MSRLCGWHCIARMFWLWLVMVLCTTTQAADPILIGTTQALTGHYKEFGIEQLRGLQMWEADINARGALLGRPVKVLYYDDRSRDAGTVEGFIRLLRDDKVELLVGPFSSSLTLEASLVAEFFNTPMVATAASSEEIWARGLKNIFGTDTPANSYMEGISTVAQSGAKTLALAYADTEFGVEVAAGVRKNAADYGLSIVFDEAYPPPQRNFSELAARLNKVNADIVMAVAYLEDSVAMVKHLKRAGVNPKMLAFTVGPALNEFGAQLGAEAEGVVGVVQWLRSVPVPGAEDFAYRYRRRYGNDPGVHAVIGYSAGQILEAAVRLAGSTDHDAVRAQLGKMYFRSLLGDYQVDNTGRQIGKRNYVLQWQAGERRLIAPQAVAERELIYPLSEEGGGVKGEGN